MFFLADEVGNVFIEISNYADKLGLVGVLLVIILGGVKKFWVFGWQYQEQNERLRKMEAEKDAWRDTALKASNVASDAFSELQRRS